MHHTTDRKAHIMVFVIPVVEHWLESGTVLIKAMYVGGFKLQFTVI